MDPFVSTNKDPNKDEVSPQQPLEEKLARNPDEEVKSRQAITIRKNPSEVYSFFRGFKNLPLFMQNLIQIQILSEKRSHWIMQLRNGGTAEWDIEIVQEVPDQLIAWRTLEGSEVETAGTMRFEKAPAERGTVVHLAVDYAVPGGKLTEWALLFTGESPEMVIMKILRRLKSYLETGEIPTTEGQPSGREESSSLSHSASTSMPGSNMKH